ncbi:MAG: ParB/RepB/Spo0J family partition protein [Planctomycetes bacterium]|nr:ParB/RepB/Spo0J family partition protein [Planctomycetota bacterium]
MVPLDKLVCRMQVRELFDEEELAGLAQSIRQQGILVPLLAHREGELWVLDDGERRLRAARLVGLEAVPVLIDPRELSEAEVIQRQLVTAAQREGLKPLEEAKAIARLIEATGQSQERVAQMLGIRAGTVSKRLKLLELPGAVQAQLEREEISASAAYHIATVRSPEEQERLGAEAVAGALSRDAIAGKVQSQKRRSRSAPRRGASVRFVGKLGGDTTVTVIAPMLESVDQLIAAVEALLVRARKARGKGHTLSALAIQLRDEAKAARSAESAVKSEEA